MSRIIEAFAQFFDGSGSPLANGWLKFLESGTNNTLKPTYADENMTTPNANPIRLDGDGRCPNIFGTGVYRVILYEDDLVLHLPGVMIQTFDPVAAGGTFGLDEDIAELQANTLKRSDNDWTTFTDEPVPALEDILLIEKDITGYKRTIEIGNLPGIRGGFKNAVRNGRFDLWRRGTTQSIHGYFSCDCWQNVLISDAASVMSRISFTNGQTSVPFNPQYYLSLNVTGGTISSSAAVLQHKIPDVRTFQGEYATISFYAKSSTPLYVALDLVQSFGTNGSAAVPNIGQHTFNLTTNWNKFETTFLIPTISGKTIGDVDTDCLIINLWVEAGSDYDSRTGSLGHQTGNFDFALLQLERGQTATDFEIRPIEIETLLCGYPTANTYSFEPILKGQVTSNKNYLVNGDFNVWQENTSFTSVTALAYFADQWCGRRANSVAGMEVHRQAATSMPFKYGARIKRTTGDTSTEYFNIMQQVESIESQRLADRYATASAWIKVSPTVTTSIIAIAIQTRTAIDPTPNPYTADAVFYKNLNIGSDITTTWKRISITALIPSGTNTVVVRFYWAPSGTAGTDDWVDIGDVQLEEGYTPTPFERISHEKSILECRRFWQKSYNESVFPGAASYPGYFQHFGWYNGSTRKLVTIPLRANMRTNPSITVYDYAGNAGKITTYDTAAVATDNVTPSAVAFSENTIVIQVGTTTQVGMLAHWVANARL